jgi:beta-glucosidase/6-phospho-beta-glucosidase/beta-galactosidase
LDYYKRLTDELQHAGIRPLATLYHWDLPQALQDKGGWPNRDMVGHFSEYTDIVVRSLGDRINHWCIFNEPWVFTKLQVKNRTAAQMVLRPTWVGKSGSSCAFTNDYNKPIIEITENGSSYLDAPDAHGAVPDQRKVEFLRGYLSALARSMNDGANIRAYHCWSLLDNSSGPKATPNVSA